MVGSTANKLRIYRHVEHKFNILGFLARFGKDIAVFCGREESLRAYMRSAESFALLCKGGQVALHGEHFRVGRLGRRFADGPSFAAVVQGGEIALR